MEHIKIKNMKTVSRWYYLMFKRNKCYKATIQDRLKNRVDCVGYSDKYIGKDWWVKK